jgi:muramoyltetrapeptide carboxypeptidase
LVGGSLDGIAGVVLGDFTDCPASHGVSAHDVLAERLVTLRVPVASGLPFGHGERNAPLPLGLEAALDASAGTLTLDPGTRAGRQHAAPSDQA